MIACGSDHGHIYTFSVGTTKCLQKIRHGSFKSLVQVLSVCISFHLPFIILSYYQGSTTRERYLIASGTNDKMPDINVWEKQVCIYIYIYIRAHTNDFQRGKYILSGDEVANATYLWFRLLF